MSQNISAELVKEIRDKTSAPLLDCKKALEEQMVILKRL